MGDYEGKVRQMGWMKCGDEGDEEDEGRREGEGEFLEVGVRVDVLCEIFFGDGGSKV